MEKHMDLEFNIKLTREDLIIITMGLSNLIANDSISGRNSDGRRTVSGLRI